MVNNYTCNECKKKFSRKWNAFRHILDIHDGFATISDQRGLLVIDGDLDNKGSVSKDFLANNFLSKDFFSYPALLEQKKEEEIDQRVLEFYGRMLKPLEELEKLCNYSEPQRIKYIADTIVLALVSSNPIKTLNNTINFKRKLIGRAKIVNYVSTNMKKNPVQAESYLTNLIKSSSYFKDVKVGKLQS